MFHSLARQGTAKNVILEIILRDFWGKNLKQPN
jgi:hypothetical protein